MINTVSQRASHIYSSNQLSWIIICIGIVLRLIRYFYNPSLWFDESVIGIDLISRPISDIFNPSPDYNQAYPYAFLALVKFLTNVFGNSEYVLRSYPLFLGIFSLFLFYIVAKHFIERRAVLIALTVFATSDPLIYQSSNLKPYSSDVFFALFLYAFAIHVYSRKLDITRIILFGISGAAAVWFSNPSVFVLAGIGSCLIISSAAKKDWKEIGKLLTSIAIWVASFISNYHFYIQNLKRSFGMDMKMMLLRDNSYMPIPPTSIADIKWFIELFINIFNYPVGISFTGIALLAFIVGCVSMYSLKRQNFFMIISPLMFAFLAGILHEFPFRDSRLILFLLPSILLVIAEGTEYIRSSIMNASSKIGILFIVLLLFQPLSRSTFRAVQPFYDEDIRSVLKYVKYHWQSGDILYVHYYAQYPFIYYSKHYPRPYNFDENEYIIGTAQRSWYNHWRRQEVSKYYAPETPIQQSPVEIFKIYRNDLDKLRGNKRVWILFTSSIPKDGMLEEKYFVHYLSSIGNTINLFGQPGKGTVYLYDLSSAGQLISN